jgi:hypothetical protein
MKTNSSVRTDCDPYHVFMPTPVRRPCKRAGISRPYLPAESDSGMFGGNSNWRGQSGCRSTHSSSVRCCSITATTATHSQSSAHRFGPSHEPVSGAEEIGRRLANIFLKDKTGYRPVFGGTRNFRKIPTGAIACCSTSIFTGTTERAWVPATKTGWTGVIARIMQLFAVVQHPSRLFRRATELFEKSAAATKSLRRQFHPKFCYPAV